MKVGRGTRRRRASGRTRAGTPSSPRGGRIEKTPKLRPVPDLQRVTLMVGVRLDLFREILARQLANEPGLQVVGQARDEDGIRSLLRKENPQVLLLDYEELGPNAESMIPRLRRAAPKTRILVLATRSSDEAVERVLRVGAAGLVGKQLGLTTLVRAIRVVAAGELWANRRVTAQAVEHLANVTGRNPWDAENLTSRESEIADAVGRGLRNKDIARRLDISEKTVKSHLNNIFRKLQVDNRFAVGLYALSLKPGA